MVRNWNRLRQIQSRNIRLRTFTDVMSLKKKKFSLRFGITGNTALYSNYYARVSRIWCHFQSIRDKLHKGINALGFTCNFYTVTELENSKWQPFPSSSYTGIFFLNDQPHPELTNYILGLWCWSFAAYSTWNRVVVLTRGFKQYLSIKAENPSLYYSVPKQAII